MASNRRVKVNQLEQAFAELLTEFKEQCEQEVDEALEQAAETANEEVKKEPPGAGKYHSWKSYSNGWKVDKEVRAYGTTYTIHNKKKYQLTHLLEEGHVNVDGSRARAFPHVAPAAEKAVKELLRRLTNGI